MNKKIISGFLMFALAVFSMSSFVACKDYDEDSYDDLKARLNKEISLREALEQQVNTLDAYVKTLKSCTCDPSKYASKEEFDKAWKRIDSIADALSKIKPGTGKDYDKEIKELYANDSLMLKKINEINSWIVYVQNLAKQDSIRIDANSARIDSIAGAITGWGETLTKLYTRVDSIVQALKHHKNDTIWIGGGDSLLIEKIAKAQFTADSALIVAERALLLAVNNSNRIGQLENYVNTLATRGELANEVRWLNDRIDDLLDKQITGILIQGTESPVIGYFNTPLDVRSQILAAYYGEVTGTVKFPAITNTADLVDISMAWDGRNLEVMGGAPSQVSISGKFVSQKNGKEEGNAGTLYLTLNPAQVDFEGREIKLETSQGKEAAITLSPLKLSEKELTFGYTRASNGFYETEATLTKDNIDAAKMKIDYTTLEEEAKAIINEKSKASVLNFGAALMRNVKDLMPAYAVKATWTAPWRTDGSNKVSNYDVYSQYGIAATAIKPLSYSFLKDLNITIPGETRIENAIDAAIAELSSLPITERDNLKSRLDGYVTRVYNKLNSIFSKYPNLALQPCLIAIANDKAKMMSQTFSNPTKISGTSVDLVPTSYSLELLAPAYKKFVAVTNVWNADGTEAAASVGKAANGENMLKVIDTEKTCTLNGQAGYIYEISYSAVDYHGKIVTKKFYVQF